MEVVGGLVASDRRQLSVPWPVFGPEELAALRRVLESGEWGHVGAGGDYVGHFEPAFERSFADLHTAQHGRCVANGTVALQLALEALDHIDDGEVPIDESVGRSPGREMQKASP